ncbi:MAG: hypothetical protein MJB14_00540 [Spirochaetes bacterium]|nr:hypothetical protein [Spirochaetota bacterium]
MNFKKFNFCLLIIILLLNGLLLYSVNIDNFLIKKLNKSEKSAALSKKGVNLYLKMSKEKNYEAVDTVREFFLLALWLDINNIEAIEFLKKTNEFKIYNFRKHYKSADLYYQKLQNMKEDHPSREQTMFNACFYLQEALHIDSETQLIQELRKELQPTLRYLQNEYLKTGNKLKKDIKKLSDNSEKIKKVFEGYRNYGKALLLEPENKSAKREKQYFEEELVVLMDILYDETVTLIDNEEFDRVNQNINELNSYSKRADNIYKSKIQKVNYLKLVKEAKIYFDKKNLNLAKKRIRSAMAIEKSEEAITLKKEIDKIIAQNTAYIQARQTAIANAQEFNKTIEQIDELIVMEEYILAQSQVKSLLETVKQKSYRQELSNYLTNINNIINQKLPPLYKKAVEHYNNEEFDAAIDLFNQVMDINPNYENAKNYLDKAIAKKKALESF